MIKPFIYTLTLKFALHYPPLVQDGILIEENIEIMKAAIQERIKETTKSEDISS